MGSQPLTGPGPALPWELPRHSTQHILTSAAMLGAVPSTSWVPHTSADLKPSPSSSSRTLTPGPGPIQAVTTEPQAGPRGLWGPPVPTSLCRLYGNSNGTRSRNRSKARSDVCPLGGCSLLSFPLAPRCLYRPHRSVQDHCAAKSGACNRSKPLVHPILLSAAWRGCASLGHLDSAKFSSAA